MPKSFGLSSRSVPIWKPGITRFRCISSINSLPIVFPANARRPFRGLFGYRKFEILSGPEHWNVPAGICRGLDGAGSVLGCQNHKT